MSSTATVVLDEVIEPALGGITLVVGDPRTVEYAAPAEVLQRVR